MDTAVLQQLHDELNTAPAWPWANLTAWLERARPVPEPDRPEVWAEVDGWISDPFGARAIAQRAAARVYGGSLRIEYVVRIRDTPS